MPTQLSIRLTNNASPPTVRAFFASFSARSVRFWPRWICASNATASRLPWCFCSNATACSLLPALARIAPQRSSTLKFSPCCSASRSASVTASPSSLAPPLRYDAYVRAAARSGVDFASLSLMAEITSSYWPSAHWARYCRIWTGRVLEEEKSEGEKSETTAEYWPCTKAVWMLTSSPSVLKGSMVGVCSLNGWVEVLGLSFRLEGVV